MNGWLPPRTSTWGREISLLLPSLVQAIVVHVVRCRRSSFVPWDAKPFLPLGLPFWVQGKGRAQVRSEFI